MKALVTGGGGFIGRRIAELLLERGDEVTILARGRYPEVEKMGAASVQVDLCDREATRRAVEGHDVVFHVAAKAGFWGKPGRNDFWTVNVDGTRNLLDAVEAAGVGRLVYTSTPSVVGYEHDVENGGADLPYAEVHRSPYPESKAAAEREVLGANGRHVATVALRPHLVFGPGDNNLLPRVVDRARSGRLVIVGDGSARVDCTYVDNAAWAHLDAADALTGPDVACAGKAYFISNDEPVVLWDWVNGILEGLDLPPVTRRASYGLVRGAAGLMQLLWDHLPLSGEPPMTPFVVDGLARSHWYDMEPARRDLGYRVRVGMEEGTTRTVGWLRER